MNKEMCTESVSHNPTLLKNSETDKVLMRYLTIIMLFLLYFVPVGAVYTQSIQSHPSGRDHTGVIGHHIHDRPDSYAPIGVMGNHVHKAGEGMFTYRFMSMNMRGNLDGADRISTSDILKDFMVSPTSMKMEMHMIDGMYAPTDNLTLMAMLPYIRFSMHHINSMGVRFATRSEGIGDFKVMPLYTFYREGRHSFHFNAGMSFPTGSIDKKDDTPAGPNQKLPYPMQLGSGTFDLLPGITYLGQTENWSWGGQPMGTIRLGENSNHYTLGNRLHLTTWAARKWTDWFSTSARLDWQIWRNIKGDDPDLNPMMVPTADPDRRGGERVDILCGVNLYAAEGKFKGHRLAIESGWPIYQSLDGPQLETDWKLTVGWQWTF
ncbi:MAG: transporter [Planctomycetota bacterium]